MLAAANDDIWDAGGDTLPALWDGAGADRTAASRRIAEQPVEERAGDIERDGAMVGRGRGAGDDLAIDQYS